MNRRQQLRRNRNIRHIENERQRINDGDERTTAMVQARNERRRISQRQRGRDNTVLINQYRNNPSTLTTAQQEQARRLLDQRQRNNQRHRERRMRMREMARRSIQPDELNDSSQINELSDTLDHQNIQQNQNQVNSTNNTTTNNLQQVQEQQNQNQETSDNDDQSNIQQQQHDNVQNQQNENLNDNDDDDDDDDDDDIVIVVINPRLRTDFTNGQLSTFASSMVDASEFNNAQIDDQRNWIQSVLGLAEPTVNDMHSMSSNMRSMPSNTPIILEEIPGFHARMARDFNDIDDGTRCPVCLTQIQDMIVETPEKLIYTYVCCNVLICLICAKQWHIANDRCVICNDDLRSRLP